MRSACSCVASLSSVEDIQRGFGAVGVHDTFILLAGVAVEQG